MTAPKLPPPLDFYNRPPKELAGYSSVTVNPGDEVPAPTRPASPGESITLWTGFAPWTLYQQPAALTDYGEFKKVPFNATPYNYARITVHLKELGATNARFRLFYSPTGASGTYVSAGLLGPLDVLIGSAGGATADVPRYGGGFLVPAASQHAFFAVQMLDGDGNASPQGDLVTVQFETQQLIIRPPITRYFCPAVPGVEPSASVHSGGWVDVFGVNGALTLKPVWNRRLWDSPVVDAPLGANQAESEANGWVFTTVNGGHGGWTFGVDDQLPPNPAIQRAGAVMLICLNDREQKATKSITLPPHAKGYVARGYGVFKGGTWTVVGFPGQCAPGFGGTSCGGTALCCLPIAGFMAAAGFQMLFVAAFYGMTHDLARPWGRVHSVIPAGVDGAQNIVIGLQGGVGYGTSICGVGGVAIAVNEETEPPGSFCPSAGNDTEMLETETDYDAKRAAGPLKRFLDNPLATQTVPAWTYQVRIAAGLSAGTRHAVGHVHVRVYLWRESDDSVVAVLGDATTPQLDATVREYDLAIAGAQVSVLDGDRFVVEVSGSMDTPADNQFNGFGSTTLRTTESDGIRFEYNGGDTSFSDGSAPGAGGAAAHIILPGVDYA